MKKNKISRKDFILKTSKVAGGLVICPAIITILQSCDNNSISSSSSSNSCVDTGNNLFAQCTNHGAKFNTDGCPIQGPATEPLQAYAWELNNNELLIESVVIVDVDALQIGTAIALDSNEIDEKGLLVYRKSESEFNVLSRTCTHAGSLVRAFDQES